MAENKSKVKIVGKNTKVVFAVTPSSLSEGRTANYDTWNLVHTPVDLYAYRNTTSRNWEIQAVLVSRTEKEAIANAKALNTVRSWLLPDFAASGAPPEILKFSAYNDPNINSVTCILRNYSWNYPSDVDYVFVADHKMPIIGTLGISLIEIYSAKQIQEAQIWKIKDIGNDTIKNPDGYGKTPPDFLTIKTDFEKPITQLLTDEISPGFNPTGDPQNFLQNIQSPNLNQIVRDTFSGLPNPTPFISAPNGFGNGE